MAMNIDIETYSDINLKDQGLYKYVDSPFFEILLISYSIDGSHIVTLDMSDFPDTSVFLRMLTNQNILKKAFNAPFEIVCLSKHFNLQLDVRQWRDTAVHCRYLGLPHSLEKAAAVIFPNQEDMQKLDGGKALITYFSKPCRPTKTNGGRTRNMPHHAPDKWAEYIKYNRQDVVAEMSISEKLGRIPVPDSVWEEWFMDFDINQQGIRADIDFVNRAIEAVESNARALYTEAVDITGLANPSSVSQLKQWIEEELNSEVSDLQKGTVATMLKEVESGDVKRMLEIRQQLSKTSLKKYTSLSNCVCSDGRMHGILYFYGARTGRWSGRLFQPQNLAKIDMKEYDLRYARNLTIDGNLEMMELMYPSVAYTLSNLIRTVLIPDQDKEMFVVDFTSIEAVLLGYFAGEHWITDTYKDEKDLYSFQAARMFGGEPLQYPKGTKERDNGKTMMLACGYGGGKNAVLKFIKPGQMSDEEIMSNVRLYRKTNPAIVRFWRDVEEKAKLAIMEQRKVTVNQFLSFRYHYGMLRMTLPSGREISYFNARMDEHPFRPGEKCIAFDTNKKKWGMETTYGGKLVENFIQAAARDCLVEAMKRSRQAGYEVLLTVHDEIICQKQKGDIKELLALINQPIGWMPGLILRAAGEPPAPFYCK